MLARVFTLLLAAASAVLADVAITSPTGGSTVANTALSVALSGASGMNVQVQVVAGGQKSDLSDSMVVYAPAAAAYTGAISVQVPAASGPNAAFAAYYLRVIATPTSGSPSYIFSQRFTMTGMTGAWTSTTIQAAAQAAAASGNSAVPANVAGGAAAAAPSAAAGTNIAFSLQTGLIKYAPMQGKPGTAITATNTAPLYPTSAWSVFTTNAPIPSQTHTVTPSVTYSASSRENTASAKGGPSNDMAKYLARWVD